QDDSDDAKLLQGPPTKFVTSYLQPVVCEPLFLHIAHREIFCLCVVKVHIVLTSEANQQNYRSSCGQPHRPWGLLLPKVRVRNVISTPGGRNVVEITAIMVRGRDD
ncbi:hypothetical protein PV325_000655, partial [Microctonus aethiopoides]